MSTLKERWKTYKRSARYYGHYKRAKRAITHTLWNAYGLINPRATLSRPPICMPILADTLVFMPTYAPDKEVTQAAARPALPLSLAAIRHRCLGNRNHAPWMYLDAIDSIRATLGREAQLVVADFRSSEGIRDILRTHQASADMPNYELWCSEQKHSQWQAMNLTLREKLRAQPNLQWVIYTSSDIMWWQRGWLGEILLAMNRDANAWVAYPTVTSGERFVDYQLGSGPKNKPAFRADLCNAFVAVFRADFFRLLDDKYPDIFRNCFSEAFIPLLLQCFGAHQIVVPRANCFHYGGGDAWRDEAGSMYAGAAERPLYDKLWQELNQFRRDNAVDIKALPFLKKLLYRDESYYQGVAYTVFKSGCSL